MFRPFPAAAFKAGLAKAKKVAVLDRNCSFGAGGIFAQELKAALYGERSNGGQKTPHGAPAVYSYITGLGGRDVTVDTIASMYEQTRDAEQPADESVWLGLSEELLQS